MNNIEVKNLKDISACEALEIYVDKNFGQYKLTF